MKCVKDIIQKEGIKEMKCKLCRKEIERDYGRPKTWCSMECKNKYNNQNRKSIKRTKQIKCKTCGKLSLNTYCNKHCYPKHKTWQTHLRYKKNLVCYNSLTLRNK